MKALNFTSNQTKLIAKDLRDDVEAGFLRQEDVGDLSENFPVLIDQVALLSGLAHAREVIIKGVSSGGVLTRPRLLALNEVDKMQAILERQSNGLLKSLEGVKNKIHKKVGVDELENSTVGILYQNLNPFVRFGRGGGRN